jgi:putative ABC transport system permease protein
MREWWSKIRVLLAGRNTLADELREELDAHLELEIQEDVDRGMLPEDARKAARLHFGNTALVRESAQDAWTFGTFEVLVKDLVYASRMLVKNRGFTAVAVATLALGIGANSAIFSVVNAVLLNPLPYPDPEHLMWGSGRTPNGFTGAAVSAPDFQDYRDQNRTFQQVAAFFVFGAVPQSWSVNGRARQLKGAMVTAGFFETLGFSPILGRPFTGADEQTQNPQVAVLSYDLWQQAFGGNPNVVGLTARLDANPITIVGVMPPSLDFPKGVDFWFPAPMRAAGLQRRTGHVLFVLGRLRRDMTQAQAQNDLDAIALRLGEQFPPTNQGWGVHLQPMREAIVGSSRSVLVMLLGAVGLVLLIACVNIANLLLARYGARQREISIRTALGAGRLRILCQFLTENLLLALVAGGLALALAWWGIELLRRLSPETLPRVQEVRLDMRVLAFTAAISMATAVLFGLAPAWLATSSGSLGGLRDDSRAGTGRGRHALGGALVVAETALSICLLIAATLLIESLHRTLHAPPGFATKNVVSMGLMLPKTGDAAHVDRLVEQVTAAVRDLPRVAAVGAISEMPIHNEFNDMFFDIVEHPLRVHEERYDEDFRRVTPGYFQAMQIPLLRGRALDNRDQPSSPLCAVIDEPFAHRYFPNEDPIGKHLRFGETIEIVGIVAGVRNHSLQTVPQPTIYLPFAQSHSDNLHLVVRTSAASVALSDAIHRIVAGLDPDVALSGFETLEGFIAQSVSGAVFDTMLLGLFATLALILSMAGVYGVFSYIVTQQTHEIGIRMALGARPVQVLSQFLARGVRLTAMGGVLGLSGAFFLMNVLAAQLYEVKPRDPLAFAAAAALLVVVGLFACAIPARRAMKVDPLVALRHE